MAKLTAPIDSVEVTMSLREWVKLYLRAGACNISDGLILDKAVEEMTFDEAYGYYSDYEGEQYERLIAQIEGEGDATTTHAQPKMEDMN